MVKILLLSENKENINKIKEILGDGKINLIIKEIPQHLTLKPILSTLPKGEKDKGIKLLLIDISKLFLQKNSSAFRNNRNFSIIFDELNKYDIAKLIILSLEQKSLISNNKIKFDDFVFSSQLEEELLTRINLALFRSSSTPPKNSIIVRDLVLNLDKYELTIEGRQIDLTFKEYELLKFLLQNKNKVFSREKLLSAIWGYDYYGGSRTVDVHIRRLRSKLGFPYDHMIKTIINAGYMFCIVEK